MSCVESLHLKRQAFRGSLPMGSFLMSLDRDRVAVLTVSR